jgi:hypothetical protein
MKKIQKVKGKKINYKTYIKKIDTILTEKEKTINEKK